MANILLKKKGLQSLKNTSFLCIQAFRFSLVAKKLPSFPMENGGIYSREFLRDGIAVDHEFISFLIVDRFGFFDRLDFLIPNDLVIV